MKLLGGTLLILGIILGGLFLSNHVEAQTEYKLLAPLPVDGLDTADAKTTAKTYIEGFFRLIIAVAGGLAVIMIVVGGIQYMSTDAFGEKNEGKDKIWNALWGFLLAISAWLILNTISADLTTFNLNIDRVVIKERPITNQPGDIVLPVRSGECANCVGIGVPHKTAANGGCSPVTPGGACMIDAALNSKLVNLNNIYNGPGKFEVTESFPPTVAHRDPCHAIGTCVDVGLGIGGNRTPQNNPQNIINFINSASEAGLRAEFEVPNAAQRVTYINGGVPEGSIIVVSGVLPHFSVYNTND